mmetsp:Transcript_22753/g.56365  ORF Transcript_22753/g.56365 Transcript_22753/m.56365 type:complete len:214 (-) Transcript_22753:208-849(-)
MGMRNHKHSEGVVTGQVYWFDIPPLFPGSSVFVGKWKLGAHNAHVDDLVFVGQEQRIDTTILADMLHLFLLVVIFLSKAFWEFLQSVHEMVGDLFSVSQFERRLDPSIVKKRHVLGQRHKQEYPAPHKSTKDTGHDAVQFGPNAKGHILLFALLLKEFSPPRALVSSLLPSFLEAGIEIGLFFGRYESTVIADIVNVASVFASRSLYVSLDIV